MNLKDFTEFLKREFPNRAGITLPQFERSEELDFEWKPKSADEFYTLVNKAPVDILIGFGFRKWTIQEDVLGTGNATKKYNIGEEILLFPGEWYNLIPDNYRVINLFGEVYPFHRGTNSSDTRHGCLGYGIKRS